MFCPLCVVPSLSLQIFNYLQVTTVAKVCGWKQEQITFFLRFFNGTLWNANALYFLPCLIQFNGSFCSTKIVFSCLQLSTSNSINVFLLDVWSGKIDDIKIVKNEITMKPVNKDTVCNDINLFHFLILNTLFLIGMYNVLNFKPVRNNDT